MSPAKAHIVAQLQKEILAMQGFKATEHNAAVDARLGPVRYAFPNAHFPVGQMHEFVYPGWEDAAATRGFVSGLLSCLMNTNGHALWIGNELNIFPPALHLFGIAPERIIFIEPKKDRDMLWAMEEALKCSGLSAVIGEVPEISFTASRRLQLAVEESKVTGFILRKDPRNLATSACVSRWKICPLPGNAYGLPGVGFPKWHVELLKVRNGKPGAWEVEWNDGFKFTNKPAISLPRIEKRKAV